MRVLLDTNVVIDFLLKRTPFDIDAKEIFRRSALGDCEILFLLLRQLTYFIQFAKRKIKMSHLFRLKV